MTFIIGLMMIVYVLFVAMLLKTIKFDDGKYELKYKAILAIIFVLMAFMCSILNTNSVYLILVVAALIAGGNGDILLAQSKGHDNYFKAGAISFLIGHLFYIAAFFSITGSISIWRSVLTIFPFICSVLLVRMIAGKIQDMSLKIIAAIYLTVIAIMFMLAISAAMTTIRGETAAYLIVIGAGAFYLSDMYVAREQFIKSDMENRMVGLPLYYSAQLLMAISVGAV